MYIKLLLANNYSYNSKKIKRAELKEKWNYKENKEHPDIVSPYNRTLRESSFPRFSTPLPELHFC